jgi:vacuolar-type H+-ATPase subunit I/STV1
LKQARGSAKYWIPQLCQALKEENSNLSNEDIRDRVVKDCISIWQKDTIRDALPDEYKDKQKQEAARISHKNRNKSGQSTAFDESGTGAGLNPAESFSSKPTEQESQTFDRPESEEVNRLRSQLSKKDEELKEVIEENTKLREIRVSPDIQNLERQLAEKDKTIERLKLQSLKPDIKLNEDTTILYSKSLKILDEDMIRVYNAKIEYMNENINNGFKKSITKKRPAVFRFSVVDEDGYLLPMLFSIDIFERKLLLAWNRKELNLST